MEETHHLQRPAWLRQCPKTCRAPAAHLAGIAALPFQPDGVEGVRIDLQGLQEPHLLQLFPQSFELPARRLLQPLQGRGVPVVGDEQSRRPRIKDVQRDMAVDHVVHGVFCVGVCRPCQIPQPTISREQNPLLVQPPSGKLDQAMEGHHGGGFASQMHHQNPLSPVREGAKPHQLGGPGLMVEQRLAAAIQGAQRGRFRGLEPKVRLHILEDRQRNGVEGIQGPSGHLEKSDMKCGRQPVVVPIARRNGDTLLGGEGKKVLDLKRGQIRRELS
jgi:hypothetical protein